MGTPDCTTSWQTNTLGPMTRTLSIHDLPDEGATRAFARSLSTMLMPGDVIALEGDMGVGKTTLVRYIADALGVPSGVVSSPTFVVINQYAIPARESTAAAHPLAPGQLIHVAVDALALAGEEVPDGVGK